MRPYLVSVVIICAIFSCCDSQTNFVPIPINTPESRRIMNIAADHIGVELIREISAFKKVNYPLYRVNFEARNNFSGNILTCNALVYEPSIGNGMVYRWNCLF